MYQLLESVSCNLVPNFFGTELWYHVPVRMSQALDQGIFILSQFVLVLIDTKSQ